MSSRSVAATLAIVLLGATLGGTSRADAIDPQLPVVMAVGTARGPSTQSRLDDRRSGTSSTALPAAPSELWRRTIGTVEVPPLVDADGSLTFTLASAEVVKLAADGKELWRTRLQGGGPAAPPVRLASGAVAVLSAGGVLSAIGEHGKLEFATSLGARGADLGPAPVATPDGGVVVVAGRTLFTLGSDGAVRTETPLREHIMATPVLAPSGFVLVADDGAVSVVRPPRKPRRVGAFASAVEGGVVLADDRTLLGVARDRLLALDLETGVVSVRASTGSSANIDAPVTALPDHSVLFTTSDGLLTSIDRGGQEQWRAIVERVTPSTGAPAAPPTFGTFGNPPPATPVPRASPPLLADAHGHVVYLRSNGRLGVAATSGPRTVASGAGGGAHGANDPAPVVVTLASEHACTNPVAIVPAGDRRFVVTCREGQVALFGE